jgi:hypothetical protein
LEIAANDEAVLTPAVSQPVSIGVNYLQLNWCYSNFFTPRDVSLIYTANVFLKKNKNMKFLAHV